ncbi:WD40/YVTN/BNR-like repeat-containing protein [Colwelliaceae bacterium BS250]
MNRVCKFIFFSYAYITMAFSLSASANNQPVEAEILPLASKSLMLDIFKISQQKIIAVGDRGHILLSSDGETWQQVMSPVNSALTKVTFINEQLGWAVGHDATILNTQDGGNTWTLQNYQPEKQRPFFDVHFFNENHGFAIGAYGLFYRTMDAGKTWEEEFHLELLNEDDRFYLEDVKLEDEQLYLEEVASILPHFNRVTANGDELFLAGELGMISSSNDQGITWQLLDEIYMGSFFDIEALTDNKLLVVGLRGNMFISNDNGQQWQKIPNNSTALLNDIVTTDTGKVFVLANSGVILSSTNGTDFSLSTQADGKALLAGVWFNNKLVVASEVGVKVVDIQ